MNNVGVLNRLLQARIDSDELRMGELGEKMFRMYSERGFPPDMLLDSLSGFSDYTESDRILIVESYLANMLEHKRKAGITEERVAKQRQQNQRIMERFIKTGELGMY